MHSVTGDPTRLRVGQRLQLPLERKFSAGWHLLTAIEEGHNWLHHDGWWLTFGDERVFCYEGEPVRVERAAVAGESAA